MKKTLLLSAVALAAITANAQDTPGVVTWDFNTHGIFASFQDPEDPFLYREGNYDFVDKYGKAVNTDGEQFVTVIKTEATETEDAYNTNYGKNNRIISLYDGVTYAVQPEADYENGTFAAAATEDPEILNHPFLGWKQAGEDGKSLGPCRIIWMYGWGSLDEWEDKNYNAIDADNWVATKHALSLQRCGQGEGSIQSYVQFPEVKLPCKVTYYVGHAGGKYAPTLRVKMQPVINGVEGDLLTTVNDEEIEIKKMYKKEVKFDGEGTASIRIWADGRELHLYHVVFDSNYDGKDADFKIDFTGIASVTVDADKTGAVYNVYGQQVNENYKGIVIKGGRKYLQR